MCSYALYGRFPVPNPFVLRERNPFIVPDDFYPFFVFYSFCVMLVILIMWDHFEITGYVVYPDILFSQAVDEYWTIKVSINKNGWNIKLLLLLLIRIV